MLSRKARRLTKAELRAAGASPSLLLHRVGPDGRARLAQLAPEGPERRRDFIRRLSHDTEDTKASEEA